MTASAADIALVEQWNATEYPFSEQATICDLVGAAAMQWPDRAALVDESGVAFTHAELDRRADAIARLLASLGQGGGSLVALITGHAPESIAAYLGVLRSGAGYVPVDPSWPRQRMLDILEPLGIQCLICTADNAVRAIDVAWSIGSVRHLVCPDRIEAALAPEAIRTGTTELWDHVAAHADLGRSSGFNVRDDECYADAEITAYRDHVLGLVRAAASVAMRRPRILEIGCGTGLILRSLAAEADCTGLDPSPRALEALGSWARETGHELELVQGFAHETAAKLAGPFDIVLLSSTVQFFPGPAYLSHVLEGLAPLLAANGRLILADLIGEPATDSDTLAMPRALLTDLALATKRFRAVETHGRDGRRLARDLARRYDAVLVPGADGPMPQRRIWTGWHVAHAPADQALDTPQADSLAYVIFTSGSTGVPKGVAVTHRPVVNLIEFSNRVFGVLPDDRLLHVTSFSFDLSVYDMFGVLAAGASIRVVDDTTIRDPDRLVDVLATEPITLWDSAPAALVSLMPLARLRLRPDARRMLVLLGGDWVPLPLPDEMRRLFPAARIVVYGGATEATVWSNYFEVGDVDPDWPSIPYGRPIQNARYYVLDADKCPCPIGSEGDLFIGGICLSQGYHNAPELTAAKFVPDPFVAHSGARMYATGDRAIWHRNGSMEFRGRRDDQVKVRGYRIELGDVQAALRACHGVIDCAVLAVGADTTRRLAGFVLAPSHPEPATLLAELRRRLPAPMVPASLVVLDSFPVGPTGKTDRAKLREMAERGAAALPRASGDATAEMVSSLWCAALGADSLSTEDDFFSCGGDSLIAVQLVVQLRQAFGIGFQVRELFDRPTLAETVETVEQRLAAGSCEAVASREEA